MRLSALIGYLQRAGISYLQTDLKTNVLTTGDTILLARDERYGIKEREHYEKKAVTIMKDTLQRVNTDAYNPILPFSDKAYSSKGERV
jgi:hypothetical protein